MTMRSGAALLALFLLLATFANALSKDLMHIKILDSQTQAVSRGDNGVPRNCDQVNFDAYCRSSTNTPMISTLLVQEGDGPPFRITCTIESRYSKCAPLPKGETFDARRVKHGISVYYVDDKGKLRQQLYTWVGGEPAAATTASSTVATSSASAAGGASSTAAPAAAGATPATAANPTSATASAPAAAQPVAAAPSVSATQGTVKCSFSSTPPGAEVTVDGRYVGSTPSVLSLSTGNHAVEVSLPGFARWKRELTVSPGSELTVNAVLEKAQ